MGLFTTSTGGSASTMMWVNVTSSTTATVTNGYSVVDDTLWVSDDIHRELKAGRAYTLPDGSRIEIDAKGNYKVLDDDAQVIYQACRIRAFNRFLNASELIEQFIA